MPLNQADLHSELRGVICLHFRLAIVRNRAAVSANENAPVAGLLLGIRMQASLTSSELFAAGTSILFTCRDQSRNFHRHPSNGSNQLFPRFSDIDISTLCTHANFGNMLHPDSHAPKRYASRWIPSCVTQHAYGVDLTWSARAARKAKAWNLHSAAIRVGSSLASVLQALPTRVRTCCDPQEPRDPNMT